MNVSKLINYFDVHVLNWPKYYGMGPTLKEYGQVGYHFLSPPWLLVP
jgi:hypothetical protein